MGVFDFLKSTTVQAVSGLADSIGSAFDKNFTSAQEKLEKRNELVSGANTLVSELNNLRAQVILAEAGGSALQRNWRPLLMLCFGVIILSTWFIFPLINLFLKDVAFGLLIESFREADKFWKVVELGLGGYVIGRSVEKVAESVSSNIVINKK